VTLLGQGVGRVETDFPCTDNKDLHEPTILARTALRLLALVHRLGIPTNSPLMM
jgi:hypothetical protein